MDRRAFVRTSAAAAAWTLAGGMRLEAAGKIPDLVAVKGGEAEAMFRRGIAALGGMRAFVKPNSKVVIKPNIGWDVPPERAGNTNPKLIAEIIKQCKEAGAKEVTVFDHTCDNWSRCYRTSGIEAAVREAGGTMAPGHAPAYYQEVKLGTGKSLTSVKEHEAILAADVFINVPILKSHSSTRLTIAMKNLMGNVWDRGYWHANDLHQCIADYAGYRKPTLNVVDAYAVMKRNGPRGVSVSDVVTMKAQLLSTDIVAIDAAGAKLLGLDPSDVRHIELAAARGVGTMELDKLAIERISL
ncbi:MAG: DUF362 domain-containing protein [Bacteroidetes bacterium]|nr:DUF362 domain-containing protein [Bacteroidota bacterium]